jgi:hypothetical protein
MYSRNGQTRKHTTGQNKCDSNTQVEPELRVAGVLGEILVGVLECLHHITKRHGQRAHDGREGVEEAEEGESSNAQRRAIGGSARRRGAHGQGRHPSAER